MENPVMNQMINQLCSEIKAGKYTYEDKLPSESQLAKEYKLPKKYVKIAFKALEDQGWIMTKEGDKRLIKDPLEEVPLHLSGNRSFTLEMTYQRYHLETKPIFFGKIRYDQEIYQALQISKENTAYKLGRLRLFNQRPVVLQISYVSDAVFPDIGTEGSEVNSLFRYFEDKGYRQFTSGYTRIKINQASRYEMKLLGCLETTQLLVVETNCIDALSNQVLEISKQIYRGNSFHYHEREGKQGQIL